MTTLALSRSDILGWLLETDAERLEELWRAADEMRRATVGDEVHLRGLIEISNHCRRQCHYCGIRAGNRKLKRYRMSLNEILECAHLARELGYGTVVLQAGEDPGLTQEWISGAVHLIKQETGLAVTLSLGERDPQELAAWREAGADRYLLKFETSDAELFARIHPPIPGQCADPLASRLRLLKILRDLGYEVGSGIMVGIPGQTFASLVKDIELFRELDLDMIGIGPFIPHPHTPLGASSPAPRPTAPPHYGELGAARALTTSQVPNDELTTCKVLALTRLVCPQANLPSTTALATLDPASGRTHGLQRGANVVMPDLTPPRYQKLYEIYPGKGNLQEDARRRHQDVVMLLARLGRKPGVGPGARPKLSGVAL
ncbi:MAG: [FeFe] hydrogenase H-cluster radical SAM maturase HydE [Thermoleophilia bacterium]|nr:[FeFe] hydrogenase H-cluster radical SAM maturase HydE [Thermoleophilia bacterium]